MRSNEPVPELARAAHCMLRDYVQLAPGQQVLITTDTAGDRQLIEALVSASLILDARPAVVTIPQLPMQGCLADPYIPTTLAGATAGCDVWIDLTFPYLAGSAIQAKAMEGNRIRYILCSDLNAGALTRLFGGARFDDIAEIQQRLADVFFAAIGSELHITTPLGTDVRFTLAAPELLEPARVNDPGMFMLPGACTMIPKLESVRGAITVETAFHEYYTPLAEPITLQVDGRISSFSGGGIHASLLDRVLRRAGGGDYGYVIHFTQGFHPATRFTGACFVEDMRTAGADAVGLGLPFWAPGGGENHPDAVMTRQSIWIAGDQLVRDGRIVGGGALAERAAILLPYYR